MSGDFIVYKALKELVKEGNFEEVQKEFDRVQSISRDYEKRCQAQAQEQIEKYKKENEHLCNDIKLYQSELDSYRNGAEHNEELFIKLNSEIHELQVCVRTLAKLVK